MSGPSVTDAAGLSGACHRTSSAGQQTKAQCFLTAVRRPLPADAAGIGGITQRRSSESDRTTLQAPGSGADSGGSGASNGGELVAA